MKKTTLALGVLLILSISCFGISSGMGIRSLAMGGAGIAIANDSSAAYFNPAGIMYGSDNFSSLGYIGGAAAGMNEVLAAASSGTNFITDNFDKNLTTNANFRGGMGLSIKKFGLSAIVDSMFEFNKPAGSLNINYSGTLTESFPITLGSTFSTPMLPEVAFGVNIKPISQQQIITAIASSGVTGVGTQDVTLGSGFGFDIGAQAKITPFITGGFVIRNLAASINSNVDSTELTVYPVTGTIETGTTTKSSKTSSLPMEIGIGVAGLVPQTGTILTGDINLYSEDNSSYADLHLGVEQKLLFNILALRLGYYTYGPMSDSFLTYGAEALGLGFAVANSTKDAANSIVLLGYNASF